MIIGVQIKAIPKLEKMDNQTYYVSELDEKKHSTLFLPIYTAKNENAPKGRVIDLLLYKNLYCPSDKLYTFQEKKLWKTDRKEIIRNCFATSSTKNVFKKHRDKCSEKKPCVMKFPEGKHFVFKEFYEKVPFYFLGTADSEYLKNYFHTNFGFKNNFL